MQKNGQQFHRRNTFSSFKDLVEYSKEAVYFIVRLRDVEGESYWQNLGTGFLVGEYKLMTCAHCVSDTKHPDEDMAQHKDGDVYLFVQRDEEGAFHRVAMVGNKDENVFIYPDIDTAVMILPKGFYEVDGKPFRNQQKYFELCDATIGLGSDIGILGYPFSAITFDGEGEVDISEVYIRADKGVINTLRHYSDVSMYESTTAFNPGNSGGPIFDAKTGTVVGMVHGYNPIPMHWVEDEADDGNGGTTSVKFRLRTIYSVGIASKSMSDVVSDHKLGHRAK